MLFAILHNIRSLYNVGSIFRTADAAGVATLYLCGITGTPPRKEISKVALGAEQHVPWEYVHRTSDVVRRLKKQGVRILALERTRKSIDYRALRNLGEGVSKQHIALLVGNEVEGLPPALLRRADTVIHIPMAGAKESLNVSVAFGIAIYSLR